MTITTIAGFALAAPAAAVAPSVTLAGSSSLSAQGSSELVTFRYSISTVDVLSGAALTLNQAASLPVDVNTVRLDGGNPITQGASGFDLGTLDAGSHTVSFTATVPATVAPNAAAQSSATLTYTEMSVAGHVVSPTVTTTVNEPDLALTYPPESGQDQVGLLGTGNLIALVSLVTNNGFGSPNTDFVIDQPAGVAAVPDFIFRADSGTALNCTPDAGTPSRLVCPIGSFRHGESIYVIAGFTTTAAAQVGQTATLTVSAQAEDPSLIDQTPADNSKQATVQFTGVAHLTYTITPSTTKVVLGKSVTLTVTVHNQGPQPATETLADVFVDETHFSVQHFDGALIPSDGSTILGSTAAGGSTKSSALSLAKSNAFGLTTKAGNAGSGPVQVNGLWKSTGSLSSTARTNALAATSMATGLASIKAGPSGGISVSASSDAGSFLWDIGTLQPGRTATAHLTLKATSLGTLQAGITGQSDAGDPQCPSLLNPNADASGCIALRSDVTAVRAAAVPPAASPTNPPAAATSASDLAATSNELASTGEPIGPAVTIALALMLAGGVALKIGRRRRTGPTR